VFEGRVTNEELLDHQQRLGERGRAHAELEKERARVLFRDYAKQYAAYAEAHKRSWRTDKGRIDVLVASFGSKG
jgi:hypothetical protein